MVLLLKNNLIYVTLPLDRPNNIDGVCRQCALEEVLVGGVCCKENEVNDNGVCKDNCPATRPLNDNGVCKDNCNPKIEDGGTCKCPNGQTLLNGICCPQGQVLDNGKCESSCPQSKVNNNGICGRWCYGVYKH